MTTRQERVEELIRERVSQILHEKVSDPRIGFVSITMVKVSPDLADANIHVSILGDEKQKNDSMQGLHSATSFIRGELGHNLELRLTPKLNFIRDDSLEKGSRVLTIMNRLEKQDESRIRKNKRAVKKR